ncbi:MAG: translation initiation factor IF-3 [Betaproteobacteria bacterium]|nr:MAG: translation initiation factor IF-3 [Betaproteobacteria bacterium]
MAQGKEARVNYEINAQEVRLIGVEGEQIGIVTLEIATSLAEEAEIDLVEIAPTAQPPVCRLMDYGKFRYQESKKKHEAKLKQKQIQIKEVKFRPNTGDGDYNIKLRNLINFLAEGDKAKVTLRFRGREMAHQEFGVRLLERVRNDLETYATVEQFPRMEGRQLVMILSPKKKEVKAVKPKEIKPGEIKPNAAEENSDTTQDTKDLETNFTIETKTRTEKL